MNYGSFLGVAIKHAGALPALMAATEAVIEAPIVKPKWEATKTLGDTMVPMAEDLVPLFSSGSTVTAFSVQEIQALECHAEFEAAAFDGKRLKKLWDMLGPMLPTLLPILIGQLQPKS